ncbi:MAG: glycosyltransferase family 4 protein [Anaerolineales bacterium]
MKGVLMLVNDFPPAPVGGAERQAERLSIYLAQRGVPVSVITRMFSDLKKTEYRDGYTIFRIPQFGPNKLRKVFFTLGALFMIVRKRNLFDILHAHLAFSSAVSAALAGKLLGKKVIVKFGTGGASSEVHQSENSFRGRLKLAILKRWVDLYIAMTDEMENELLAAGFAKERILRMTNGIDASIFVPPPDKELAKSDVSMSGKTIILFTGRLVAVKGVHVLLNAFRQITSIFPNVHLMLVGNGEERVALEKSARDLNIDQYVTFVGDVSDVKPYLRAAEIFVLPSFGEGISNSLLEAMSAGLACIATRVGGSSDLLLNGQHGILISPNNIDQLAEALKTLVQNNEMRKKFGNDARQFVLSQFDFSSVGARYLALYNQLALGK